MTTTCLISNFNYARFVADAIGGALRQTVPFDEIIVVDDGSTDGSLAYLKNTYGRHPRVKIVGKEHAGQLSCFNRGVAEANSDIVFFLDADDVYEPQYVERAPQVYEEHPSCDFLFCGKRTFGQREEEILPYPQDRDLGYSVLRAAYLGEWIGNVTSCLSIRRYILNKILPLPFADQWRTGADDCLIFGSSLAGARKRYLAQPLVRYRLHANNHFSGRNSDRSATYSRRLAINHLFEYLERTLYCNYPRLVTSYHREFCTIETPTFRQLVNYMRIGAHAPVSLLRRLGCTVEMVRHLVSASRQGNAIATNSERFAADRPAATVPFHLPIPSESGNSPNPTSLAGQHRRAA